MLLAERQVELLEEILSELRMFREERAERYMEMRADQERLTAKFDADQAKMEARMWGISGHVERG